jgi:acetate---CoA ligase (ADP-forming) subunit beta
MRISSEWEAKQRLGDAVPRPREALTTTTDEAVAFAAALAPAHVVAKASGVAHKTEQQLVRLGLDADGVAACWDALASAGDGTVLIAEQVSGEYELLIGGLRDEVFGPVVSVGMGGIAAEIQADAAYVLAPPHPGELERALDQLRSRPLLDGFRGRPPVDRAALGAIVQAVSDLLVDDPSVTEVDLNPVVVRAGRPIVLDALIVSDPSATHDATTTEGVPGRRADEVAP